jgi:hypothetical protein
MLASIKSFVEKLDGYVYLSDFLKHQPRFGAKSRDGGSTTSYLIRSTQQAPL